MEVKHIRYGFEYEAVAIPRMMNSVIDDMDKLEDIINSKSSIPAVGIMIVANLTRYPGNPSQYKPMNIMIDCIKKLVTQWKHSDRIVLILSDNFRAIAITAGEIKRYEARYIIYWRNKGQSWNERKKLEGPCSLNDVEKCIKMHSDFTKMHRIQVLLQKLCLLK